MHSETKSILLAILACLLWSSAFAAVKVGLQYNLPLQFAGTRFMISGLLLLPLALRNKEFFRTIYHHFPYVLLISFLHVFGLYALFYNGLNLVPGAVGAIVIGSGPLFIALLSHFMMENDRLGLKKSMVMFLGFSGIVVVTVGRQAINIQAHPMEILGVFILLLSNTMGAFANIFVARSKNKIPSLTLSASTLFIGGFGLFILAIPIEGIKTGPFPVQYWTSLAWLSMLSATAISIWFYLLKRPNVKVSSLNMWKFMIPMVGAILSWLIIPGEKPDVITIAGMVLTGMSLVLITKVDKSHNRNQARK